MIGLDTNVIVRYAARDDPEQTPLADAAIDSLSSEDPGYISLLVVAETWWVLRTAYRFPADRCRQLFEILIDARELRFETPDTVRAALDSTRQGADLADALIARCASHAGCRSVVTLDKQAAQRAGMTLLT